MVEDSAGLGRLRRHVRRSGSPWPRSPWASRRTATPSSPRAARPVGDLDASPAATWRARRSASGRSAAACAPRRPPAPRPARSTACTTASRRWAAWCRSPTCMLGEVSPGGVGAGLYGMLIFALLAVFIAGLMVGRTPEYLGKKIQAAEMKLVVLYVLVVPLRGPRLRRRLGAARARRTASILNPGPARAHRDPLRLHLGRPTTTARPSPASPATPTGTTRRSAWPCWSAASS